MGTCIAACSNTTRKGAQIEQRYIDHTVSGKIEQELNRKPTPTQNKKVQINGVLSQKSQLELNHPNMKQISVEIQPQVQKSDKMKSTKGNKSRFYHQKQNGESSLCEESISLQVNQVQSNMDSSTINNKKKRRSNRRESSQSSQLSETTEESLKQNTKSNVNYYSYSKDPTCLYGQKIPIPSTEGLDSQDEQLISIAEKYAVPTVVMKQVHLKDGSVYQGEWMSGMKHGFGTLTWDGSKYQGEFKFNQFWGKGILAFKNKMIYKGEMRQNAAWGEGELKIPDGSYYKGSWENNKQHGFGVHYWSKKEKYQGDWVNGVKQGNGTLYFQDGSYYKGSFVLNQIHGQGQYYYFNKMTYKGEWQHNQKCGNGALHFDNGETYRGGFSHDKMHGAGIYVDSEGRQFEGNWLNGKRQGVFVCTFSDGFKSKSEWYYGKQIRVIDQREQSLGLSCLKS